MKSPELVLPTTYEQSREILGPETAEYATRLAQFVQPVEATEAQVTAITARMGATSGRVVLLLGATGSGKSTFVQSLTWRKHLGFARLVSVDCADMSPASRLKDLEKRLQEECERSRKKKGRTIIAIDYLESLGGQSPEAQKALFQTINGLLRKSPVLVLWPVTNESDAALMVTQAGDVANTLFDREVPLLRFLGPSPDHFPSIAKNTVSVFNQDKLLQDFLLTEAELDQERDALVADQSSAPTIRIYLERVHALWTRKSGHLKALTSKLPKANEIWCVFCHPDAEDVIGAFAMKGGHVPSAWTAHHAKLWEYVPGTQREARWQPTRLQYAISGAFKSRIVHMSPQSLVSVCAAYGGQKVQSLSLAVPGKWKEKSTAIKHLQTTAVFRQLTGQTPSKGKTKGGPAAAARSRANVPFEALNKFAAGTGNDRHLNKAIADALADCLPKGFKVVSEQQHPWIPGITPDIRIDTPSGEQVCLEFCYTNNRKPAAVADYVLDKLAVYMDQLDVFVKK